MNYVSIDDANFFDWESISIDFDGFDKILEEVPKEEEGPRLEEVLKKAKAIAKSVFSVQGQDVVATHRIRMFKSMCVHKQEYWQQNPETLRAVVRAFEDTAPAVEREASNPARMNSEITSIILVRSEIEQLLKGQLTSRDKTELVNTYKKLSDLEEFLLLITQVNRSPVAEATPAALVNSVFEGAKQVDLFGELDSIVWNHPTLYCLVVPQEQKISSQLKSRVWVDWKRCDQSVAKAKVEVFLRANDWKPGMEKFTLKAKKTRGLKTGGWRTFKVFPFIKTKASETTPDTHLSQNLNGLPKRKITKTPRFVEKTRERNIVDGVTALWCSGHQKWCNEKDFEYKTSTATLKKSCKLFCEKNVATKRSQRLAKKSISEKPDPPDNLLL